MLSQSDHSYLQVLVAPLAGGPQVLELLRS